MSSLENSSINTEPAAVPARVSARRPLLIALLIGLLVVVIGVISECIAVGHYDGTSGQTRTDLSSAESHGSGNSRRRGEWGRHGEGCGPGVFCELVWTMSTRDAGTRRSRE